MKKKLFDDLKIPHINSINLLMSMSLENLMNFFYFVRDSYFLEKDKLEKHWNEILKEAEDDQEYYLNLQEMFSEYYLEYKENRVWLEYLLIIGLTSILENYYRRLKERLIGHIKITKSKKNRTIQDYIKEYEDANFGEKPSFFTKQNIYLKYYFDIDVSKSKADIASLEALVFIRNKIVHSEGIIKNKMKRKEFERKSIIKTKEFIGKIEEIDHKFIEERFDDVKKIGNFLSQTLKEKLK